MVNWSGAIANELPNGLNCELHILYNTSYRQCYALKDTFGVILFIPFFKKGKKKRKRQNICQTKSWMLPPPVLDEKPFNI